MSYIINGPATIGDTLQLNEILGDVRLTDITAAQGQLVYSDATNNLTALALGTANQQLRVNAGATAPEWFTASASVTEGFAVDKDAGDSFTNVATAVANWNTTSAYRLIDGGVFNVTTGVFTPATTGRFDLKGTISYTNTGGGANSGTRTLELYDNTNAAVIASVTEQPTGQNTADKYITLNTDAQLTAADDYVLRFFRSNNPGGATNTILPTSFWSAHFISV